MRRIPSSVLLIKILKKMTYWERNFKIFEIETITSPDVICKFENNTEQNGFRNVTKLPFNPDHDFLPCNNDIVKVDWLKEKILNQYNWNFLRLWETGYHWKSFFGGNNSMSRQSTLFGLLLVMIKKLLRSEQYLMPRVQTVAPRWMIAYIQVSIF